MTGTLRFPLLVAFVIIGLALGYVFLVGIGAIDFVRNEIRYYWGCPRGQVMAEDMSCAPPNFYQENSPAGEKRQ